MASIVEWLQIDEASQRRLRLELNQLDDGKLSRLASLTLSMLPVATALDIILHWEHESKAASIQPRNQQKWRMTSERKLRLGKTPIDPPSPLAQSARLTDTKDTESKSALLADIDPGSSTALPSPMRAALTCCLCGEANEDPTERLCGECRDAADRDRLEYQRASKKRRRR